MKKRVYIEPEAELIVFNINDVQMLSTTSKEGAELTGDDFGGDSPWDV